eukprot:Hpha_TRINITY_DN3407_c0_g1::TRINITY_DN3407_c0_g1_i1::g.32605::m.32605/K05349/bglX; beta-glucosidase
MCSYNAENGAPSCANGWLLNTVLRGWNPDAVVVTDCGAVTNLRGPPVKAASDLDAAVMALNNGSDLEVGSTMFRSTLPDAVAAGRTTEAAVDAAWLRLYRPHFRAGRFDPPGEVGWSSITAEAINSTEHREINREAGRQALVLLKNKDGVLPLAPGRKVAVVGPQGVTR